MNLTNLISKQNCLLSVSVILLGVTAPSQVLLIKGRQENTIQKNGNVKTNLRTEILTTVSN